MIRRGPCLRGRAGRRPAAFLLLAAVLGGCLGGATMAAVAQPIVVDTFETDQAALSLTFPPAGTTTSSSASGGGIFGGERDLELNLTAGVTSGNGLTAAVGGGAFSYSQDDTITGSARISWDGADASPVLNGTGLGGLDLTSGLTQDAFLLGVLADDVPVEVVIEVFTDDTNASSVTLTLPGAIAGATPFVVPYSAFAPSLGTGASFNDVGAITLTVGSEATAAEVVLDFLQTTATLAATQTVALLNDADGDGNADPGDTLRYTTVVTDADDSFDDDSTGVRFNNPVPANTQLVAGSIVTSQGMVVAGPAIEVDLGTLADGGSATLTFDVVIDNPLGSTSTVIASQGVVSSDTLAVVLTDDPAAPGTEDPTVISVMADLAVEATEADSLFLDANGNGLFDPGDVIQYTVVITSTGNQSATGVVFNNPLDPNVTLFDAATTTQGTVTSGTVPGDTVVTVDIGALAGGGSVTITFRVRIDDPLAPGVNQITSQGTVSSQSFPTFLTDDPATAAVDDPTVTPVRASAVAVIPTLGEWGLILLFVGLGAVGVRRLRRVAG